ncbi:MAG: thiamine biosynthesis protein ThiS [Gammaproteobacteria bacterium]|jgi:molybdopterin converting factor small subunit
MRTVEIVVFGGFRRHVPEGRVSCHAESGTTVAELRVLLTQALRERNPGFDDDGLLSASVFASEDRILGESESVDRFSQLSILPPVCGG